MALILMCGYPASGKSTVSDELSRLLRNDGKNVIIVRDGDNVEQMSQQGSRYTNDDVTTESRRALLYQDSTLEKKTRARLRSATERALSTSNVVICDSLNYIKGFRYEMYCVAKTTGTRYCVVYCEQDADWCCARDKERADQAVDAYGEDLCQALIRRFEQPAAKNRWDSPLHTINICTDDWKEKLDSIRNSALHSSGKLAPTMATKIPVKPGADVLGTLDRLTRETEAFIVQEIQGGKGVGENIIVPGVSKVLRLTRKPMIAELRNMRRSYLNVARMHPPQASSKEALISEYLEYINAQLNVNR